MVTNVLTGARVSYMVLMILETLRNETIEYWKDNYNL